MHSCCSNKHPFLFRVEKPTLRDARPGFQRTFFPHSPLRVANDPAFHAAVPIFELRSSLDVLRDAFDGFEMLCVETVNPETVPNRVLRFKSRQEKIWARLQTRGDPEKDPIPSTIVGQVQEAILTAATIHFGVVVSKIQHDDLSNTVNVHRLHNLLKKLPLDFWKTAPYLYLWMCVNSNRV